MKQNSKMCIVASAGGHMSQLLRLSSAWENKETFYITTTEVLKQRLAQYGPVYVVGESNRQQILSIIKVLARVIKTMVREQPSVVVSTGASVGCIACYIGKMIGSKVIWIDSITNVERPSLSGRLVYRIADLFLVQWPELRERYPNAEYHGAII